MNAARFLRKCLTDQAAAWISAKLVMRGVYDKIYWQFRPGKPMVWRVPGGGKISLIPGHPFTHSFWPAVDAYEPEVTGFFRHFVRPGMTVIDCGSNIGFFSVLAGKLVGPGGTVLAIEANPGTYKLVQHNLAINGYGKVIHCAITNTPGEVEIFMPAAGDVYSSLRTGKLVPKDGDLKSWRVPGRTLDEVVQSEGLSRVDIIKMDIEGGEVDGLRSASATLDRFRPLAIIEYGMNTWPSFGATPEQILALAEAHRYSVVRFDLATKSFGPLPANIWDQPYDSLVLVPRERRMIPESHA